jgi:AraC-like DNA-binding protein/quercetin dioxygenase-like cupin family protein
MKPVLEHLPKKSAESFVVEYFEFNYYPNPWHFHPEYELVLVTESCGKRFIGDRISNFMPGDLALIGPNLPHLYRNSDEYYHDKKLRASSIVVHFQESSFGENFFSLPETTALKTLFSNSCRGIDIKGETNRMVSQQIHEIMMLNDFPRWFKLLEILNVLLASDEYEYISGSGIKWTSEKESERMGKVINFVMKNFNKDISLSDAANVPNMAGNSFSRYFSPRARKPFIKYLNEVRLSHACKLLIDEKMSVVEICYECGFNNLSNFNKQFKHNLKASPSDYQKQYLKTAEPM